MGRLLAVLVLIASLETIAAGESVATAPPAVSHDFSLTGSVLLLNAQSDSARYNVLELTGEWRRGKKVGLAGILGAGRLLIEDDGAGYALGVLNIGGQAYYSLIGDFDHGLQLGLEAVFVALHGSDRYNGKTTVSVGGLSVGPFLGYKLTLDSDFTIVVQAGGGLFLSTAHASNEASDTEFREQAVSWVPLPNLNIGWSF